MTSADMTRVSSANTSSGGGAEPGSRLIGTALVLLLVLGLGLLAVSYAAQYRFIAGQRQHQEVASAIEAGCLDVGLCILSLLALGLARRGVSAVVERALVVVTALGSAGMNYAAADVSSPRSVVAYCMPPVFLAIVVDRTVATVRRHILGMRGGRSPWAAFGQAALYALRLLAAPVSTLRGLRRALLDATPLPGLAETRPPADLPAGGRRSATGASGAYGLPGPHAAPGPHSGPGPVAGTDPFGRRRGSLGAGPDPDAGTRAGESPDQDACAREGRPPVDRAGFVAALAAEMAAAADAGQEWRPDYPDLQARTGYGRSWCEKAVKDARRMLSSAKPGTEFPVRTERDRAEAARTQAAHTDRGLSVVRTEAGR